MSQDDFSLIIVGGSGNLSLTKLLPSLYNLFISGSLPNNFSITAYARSNSSNQEYRKKVEENLLKYISPTNISQKRVTNFLEHIFYVAGQYDSTKDFIKLKEQQKEIYPNDAHKTLYYLSIPPAIFFPVINSLHESNSINKNDPTKQRVIIEKPFGYDTDSAEELNKKLYNVFDEQQIYRIDHYLGKEAIQNLLVLRFANMIFEPVWNKTFIKSVEVTWQESLSIGKRGGYFDKAGIIRDVMQNHLLQILSLVAMEKPKSLSAEDIQYEKNKVLQEISPFTKEQIIIGQYKDGVCAGKHVISYTDEDSIPDTSKRDTFALIKCFIKNERWDNIPFYIKAGKALTKSCTEIKINFKDSDKNLFGHPNLLGNQLVIRIQPNAGVYFKIINKVPGKEMVLKDVNMKFNYDSNFNNHAMPDAYERLLLDAIHGDKTLFISYDELIHSWKIFTPILNEVDNNQLDLYYYHAGTQGPKEVNKLYEQS